MSKLGVSWRAICLGSVLAHVACGPHVDAAAKMDIDQRIAVMAPTGVAFPPPTTRMPKPLAAGQWAQYKMVDEKGQPSLLTYKIVGEESGAIWVEVASEGYYGKTVNKILVAIGDRGNPATFAIRSIKMKDVRGRISEVQGPDVQAARPAVQNAVNMLAVSWLGLPQESVAAVAGNFAGCYKALTDAGWGVWRSMALSWMHPAVPISGLVKSAGLAQPFVVELVGFGDSGATSEIP